MYQVVGGLLPVGFLFGFLSLKMKSKQEFLLDALYVSLSLILAFYLLQYGFDKVFKSQFYFPESNTLHTPLGHLSKDILFWSAMGSSYWYNLFMGTIEIIPALFLLHNKTRMLGAFVAFAVLLNVWMINMSFDITVKVLSTLLVLITIYLLSFYWRKLISFFTENEIIETRERTLFLNSKPILKRAVKGTIIGLFCIEILLPFLQEGEFNRDTRRISDITGSFTVIDAPSDAIINNNTKRIHFHNKGWLILEDQNQEFEDYKTRSSSACGRIEMLNENITLSLSKTNQNYLLSWEENGISLTCQLQKIDLSKMKLSKDEFHWTVESL